MLECSSFSNNVKIIYIFCYFRRLRIVLFEIFFINYRNLWIRILFPLIILDRKYITKIIFHNIFGFDKIKIYSLSDYYRAIAQNYSKLLINFSIELPYNKRLYFRFPDS